MLIVLLMVSGGDDDDDESSLAKIRKEAGRSGHLIGDQRLDLASSAD